MAGLWSRIKSWLQNENLSNSDLNAEFNNLISQIAASTISGASNYPATVAGMRATESPGSVGSEVLPVTIQDEIQQLRYLLVEITGNTYWYSAPATTIAALSSTISNLYTIPQSRIVSGRIDTNDQPMYLVPSGAAATVTFKAASTNAAVYTNGNSRTVSSDIALTGLTTAPSSNNTCTVNDSTLAGAQTTKIQGEGSVITISSIGSNISALNGTYAAFKVSTEYFIAEVDTTNNRLKNCFRGFAFNSSDTWQARVAISNGNTITLMKLAWIFLQYSSSTFSLAVTYNKPTISYASPSGPAIGDMWYDIANNTWKNYSGIAWNAIEATFAGHAICDSSNCVAARSAHFFKAFSNTNTFEIEYVSSSTVRANKLNSRVNVYGTTFYWDLTQPVFSTSTNLDSGVSLGASTSYYCYVTDLGNLFISDVSPTINTRYNLFASYHPAKPWLCVGTFNTDGSNNITSTTVQTIGSVGGSLAGDVTQSAGSQSASLTATSNSTLKTVTNLQNFNQLWNLGLSVSASGNVATIALKQADGATDASSTAPVSAGFRSSTATSGLFNIRQITAALSQTLTQGTTLGMPAQAMPVWLYLIDSDGAGTMKLGASTCRYDESQLQSTVAESFSATATNASPCVFTANGHGLNNTDAVRLTGTPPTGFSTGTTYYVVSKATNTFQLSATVGGSAINSSSTGSSIVIHVCNGRLVSDGVYTSMPVRLIGQATINNATPGNWTSPTVVASGAMIEPQTMLFMGTNNATTAFQATTITPTWTAQVDTHGGLASDRYVIQQAGKYFVEAIVPLNNTGTAGNCQIQIFKNGSVQVTNYNTPPAATAWSPVVQWEDTYAQGDYIQIKVTSSAGSAITLLGTTVANNLATFCVTRINT